MRVRLLIPTVLAALVLPCQCGTAPLAPQAAPLEQGERVEIVYRDGGTTLSMRNESSLAAATAYSAPDGDQNLKIAADEDLEDLLAGWSSVGFFGSAQADENPQAKASLTVRRGGQTWVRSRLPLSLTTTAEIQDFQTCAGLFRTVYDQTHAFHTASGVGVDDFKQESQRLQERNRNTVRTRGDQ